MNEIVGTWEITYMNEYMAMFLNGNNTYLSDHVYDERFPLF